MKKLMIMAIVLLAAGSAEAQRRYPPPRRYPPVRHVQQKRDDYNRVKFGFVGGVNISNIVDVDNANFDTKTIAGVNAGISLDIPIARPIAFEGEVLYSLKGYRAYTVDGDFTQRTSWIDVPLLAKLRVAPQFNIVVGPQISFLLQTKNTYRSGFTSTSIIDNYNRDADGFNKSLLSGVIGVGVDISPNVELRGRYNLDLSDNNTGSSAIYPNYRNQVFQIGLGVKF